MKIRQKDILEVSFNLPDGLANHPVIVLSNDDAIEDENSFIAVMLTSKKNNDEYSFEITDEMLLKKLNVDYCEARLHLISFFKENEVITNHFTNNQIKQDYFKELMKQIFRITFDQDF